ncbi:MAG: type II toxin-antitoxin system RelE/ParE family toxin [Nitrospinae bacterium]|nr:type II toxin-antitoxin system RelE/ParE family toxin [Nitrospinota bacterium]
MIRSFKDKETERLFNRNQVRTLPADIMRTAKRKLNQVDATISLRTLKVPPGNRLEALTGNRRGQYSIRINDQWRVCFRWEDGHARDVEICDYHG